jgi:hypothetical protein
MRKVIRDGKVAVLVSCGYGAGWYTWNTGHPQCLFSPEIVELIESGRKSEITNEYCEKLFGDEFYAGGAFELNIEWLPVGTAFWIDEYDGSENLRTINDLVLVA